MYKVQGRWQWEEGVRDEGNGGERGGEQMLAGHDDLRFGWLSSFGCWKDACVGCVSDRSLSLFIKLFFNYALLLYMHFFQPPADMLFTCLIIIIQKVLTVCCRLAPMAKDHP